MASALDGYSPEYAMVSPLTQRKINAALLTSGSGHPQFFLTQSAESAADLEAGRRVSSIYNSVMGRKIRLIVNPYMPESTILLGTTTIPSLMAENGSAPVIFSARRDYMAEIWPRNSRKLQNTVTIDETRCIGFMGREGMVYATPRMVQDMEMTCREYSRN
jgi:hypothetical protein